MSTKQQYDGFKQMGQLLAFAILILDVHYYCYDFFFDLGLTEEFLTRTVYELKKAGLYGNPMIPKGCVLFLTFVFVLLDRGNRDTNKDNRTIIMDAVIATCLFMSTAVIPNLVPIPLIYIAAVFISYLYLIKTYSLINRLFNNRVMKDRFNKRNKVFPQTTELIENDMSVNIPYTFVTEYKERSSGLYPIFSQGYINIVSPERATIILGKPGSGKSYSFNEEFLRQHIKKGFSLVNYDYKFPTLTNIAYNYFVTYRSSYNQYKNKGRFAVINVDDPRYDRCNPLHPDLLERRAQAMDAVKTIFFNLDKKSATKQDFFQMSAIAITSAALWFLRLYENGKYCSFPHLVEFIQQPDEKMLAILDSYEELRYFTSAFTDALKKESFEQLSGQTASARIPLGQCATDEMFYTMTDPDNTGVNLRVNLPDEVTVLSVANNPETQQTNAPALGLYMSQAAKLINAQGRVPCNFHVDELPTIFINGLNNLIATARSNKVCVTLSAQDYTQLVMNYGKEIADTIFNTIDNLISGKVAIETAEKITKSIGRINYKNQSISISENTSSTISTQREYTVPAEDIAQLSQGEFVGVVSDSFNQPIELKAFRGIVNPSKDDLGNLEVPMSNPNVTKEDLKANSKRIREEIQGIVTNEMARLQREKDEQLEIAEQQTMEEHDLNQNYEHEFNPTQDSYEMEEIPFEVPELNEVEGSKKPKKDYYDNLVEYMGPESDLTKIEE